MSKAPIALILSTGSQDLKFWTIKDGKFQDKEFPKSAMRAIHEALTGVPGPGYVLSLDKPSEVTEKALQCLFEKIDFKSDQDNTQKVCVDGQGRLLLFPAKIHRLLRRLQGSSELEVKRILIFYSDRKPGGKNERDYRQEPARTGPILGKWLGDLFGLKNGEVSWVNLLAELESVEGEPECRRDDPVRAEIARTVDASIHCLAQGFDIGGHAIVASLGGFGPVKSLIAAAADLHFDNRAYDYWETKRLDHDQLSEQPFTLKDISKGVVLPADSLAARARCAALIRQGDIQGAWGAVVHLGGSADDGPWFGKVRLLHQFFLGAEDLEELLPRDSRFPHEPGASRLLQLAFQAEAALQGEEKDRRIAEALLGVCALAEHGLFWMLHKAIPARLGLTLVVEKEEIRRDPDQPLGKEGKKALIDRLAVDLNTDIGDLLGKNREKATLKVYGDKAATWRRWLLAKNDEHQKAGRAADALERYLTSMPSGKGQHLRTLRNRLGHAVLNPNDLDTICDLARSGLWNLANSPLPHGQRFLSSPLIIDLLAPLGIQQPEKIYKDLLESVLKALTDPFSIKENRPWT